MTFYDDNYVAQAWVKRDIFYQQLGKKKMRETDGDFVFRSALVGAWM